VRKAISVAEWVDDGRLLRYRVRRYARTLDAKGLRVEEESTRQQVTRSRQPFRAPHPDSLVTHGYVQERDGELYYHAPDPRALLSDGFVRTHCFSVELPRSQRDRDLVGIGFTPVDGREVPDIAGTLWIDRGTAELRRMDFFYTGLEGVRRSAQLGGRVEFRRLRTGAWIVDRWRIRMPIRARIEAWWRSAGGRRDQVLAGIQEVGGEVLSFADADGEVAVAGGEATVRGVAWDSLHSEPLVDARVFLIGTDHETRTDEEGRFSLPGLRSGLYTVAFQHPELTRRGLFIPPRRIDVKSEGVHDVRLGLPSAAGMAEAACAEVHDTASATAGRRAVLAGTVVDALTGGPVPGATVRVELSGGGSAETATDASAAYRFCTLPAGEEATVVASFLGRDRRTEPVRLAADRPALKDVELSLTRPTAVVVEVTEHETGTPISGAEVTVEGLSTPVVTDGEGVASFPAVAPGLQGLTVDHLAYGTVSDSILVRSAETVRVRVRMATEAIELAPIEVVVEGGYDRGIGMMGPTRARGSRTDVLTLETIEEVLPRTTDTADLLRNPELAGLMITEKRRPDGQRVLCIEASRARTGLRGGGCTQAEVYVDDIHLPNPGEFILNIPPQAVERIEFLSPMEAGAIYGTGSRNGVVLICTRDGRKRR